MGRMEVQAAVRAALAEALPGTEVRASVPDPRPAELVVVRREGGAQRDPLVDSPGVGVECWAPTEAGAAALAMRASAAILSLPFSAGFADVREEACRSDYDALRRSPRWYMSYTMKTFEPPE